MKSKTIITLLVFLILNPLISQTTFFGDEPVKWSSVKPPVVPEQLKKHESSDLVILEDNAVFYFYASNNEKIARQILVKINTQKGLDKFQTFTLPESFDEAYDCNLYKQGRPSRHKVPFIAEYHVRKFGARVFTSTYWQPVTFNVKFDQPRRIKYTGEFIKDELTTFQMQNLSVGDIVELKYEADFNSLYGSNLFYFQSAYPKLTCQYDFVYKVNKNFADYSFILPVNIKDSIVKRSYTEYNEYVVFTDKIKLNNLNGVNYPANSKEAINGPHVFADFKFYRVLNGSYPTGSGRLYDYDLFRPKKFEWIIYKDTLNNYTKIYDKQFASIRKFVATLPAVTSDSSGNTTFFKAMCDTFNNFRYISANQLFYNESALYNLYSGEHLLKRRLVEHTMWKLYTDILNDKKVFYYEANVEDRRYSEHNLNFRAHYAYENNLIAIPVKNSFIYFMPRYDGIKYHLNELPFYYEGSLTALFARNFQEDTKNKDAMAFKLMKTHLGTFNENTRTENASIKISLDSLNARLTIKESLSGQFSTLLRHLYLNEHIDSTVPLHYFKKCLDKPNATAQKIKLSSSINEFPFRYTFNCSEKIVLTDAKSLNLKNWFSFILTKKIIPEMPTNDYYLDFDFSDTYNFLLDFSKAVEVTNLNDFEKSIDNALFKLESKIIKNSETSYLVKVELTTKTTMLPVKRIALLQEFLDELDKLDNFALILEHK